MMSCASRARGGGAKRRIVRHELADVDEFRVQLRRRALSRSPAAGGSERFCDFTLDFGFE
jgi:hypothetical protein